VSHTSLAGLTPTSYTLLGLLARRPWAAYELTRYMQLSALRRIWPRAESRLYEEPKKLMALGLVQAEQVYQGARKRTVYHITEAGRTVLAQWFDRPSAHLYYEYEALVKLINADHADESVLAGLVAQVRSQAQEEARALADACELILKEGWRIDETAEHNGLVVGFMRESIAARLQWARETEERLAMRRRSQEAAPLALARRWYQEEIEALRGLAEG